MKSTTVNQMSTNRYQQRLSLRRVPRLGAVAMCAVAMLLGACAPGSSGEDGVDPGVIEIPIAFIKRPIALDDMNMQVQADLREPRLFSSGGDVYLRSSTATSASVTNLTSSITGGIGDVKGLNFSSDGNKLIFSLRLFDPDPMDDVVPSWNIYEYDLIKTSLQSVISESMAQQGDDLYPAYLPDGRIVFTSNRQNLARENLLNEGKPRFQALTEDRSSLAMLLHVMNADGTGIRQISFNLSHDLYPQVLSQLEGGKIVFSRWDNAVEDKGMHFYTINPDGSELELLYGLNSHDTGSNNAEIQFGHTREMENGDLMVITRPYTGTFDGGDIVIIDAQNFIDNDRPLWSNAGLRGPAQESATINDIVNDGSLSIAGRYASAFPLWDGSSRILVSKSTCQLSVNGEVHPCIEPHLSDPSAIESAPAYAIWLYDRNKQSEKPIVLAERGIIITEAITVQERDPQPVIFDKGPDEIESSWESENVGVINIKSVYDLGGGSFGGCFFNFCTDAANIDSVQDFADPRNATAAQRPARFVRFIRPVTFPDPEDPTLVNPPDPSTTAFGPQTVRGMREIVGYAPVEPDGSVKTKVPANLPLGLEILDGEGRRLGPIHANWFQVRAGDTLTCNGCHTHDTAGATPENHGRSDATPPSINAGLPGSLQFVNTLIPGTVSPYWGNIGETMAEVRFDRAGLAIPPGAETRLNIDLIYDDYWTDPVARLPDVSFAYVYSALDASMSSPTNGFCSPWLFNCRSVINYPQHIHPIWSINRGLDFETPDMPVNPSSNDPTNTPYIPIAMPNTVGDFTCTECHTSLGGTRLPYGQLDLSDDPAQDPAEYFRAYLDLFFADQGEQLNGMNLVDLIGAAARVKPSMTANGARASYFMEKMTGTELDDNGRTVFGSVDHSVMLSGAELKLIGEWLDLGAQNFNDPFDPAAPQN